MAEEESQESQKRNVPNAHLLAHRHGWLPLPISQLSAEFNVPKFKHKTHLTENYCRWLNNRRHNRHFNGK